MKPRRDGLPLAVELVEEAVHLLRRAPLRAWAWYFAPSVAFVVLFLVFWASIAAPDADLERVGIGALLLAVAFVAMKVGQSRFCAELLGLRIGRAPEGLGWSGLQRLGLAQVALQPWVLLALVPAALCAVPLGWVFAYGNSLTVIGSADTLRTLHRRALEQGCFDPGGNHLGLALLGGATLAIWVNLMVALIAIPFLADRLLGLESIYGASWWLVFNSTYLALVVAFTWLMVDPLMKAFYTLRVFYGRAQRSGDDLLIDVARMARRPLSPVVLVALCLAMGGVMPARGAMAGAVDSAPRSAPVKPVGLRPADLDAAVEHALDDPAFAWRDRHAAEVVESRSRLGHWLSDAARSLRRAIDATGRWLGKGLRWLERALFGDDRGGGGSRGRSSGGAFIWVVLVALAAVLILYVLYWLVRGRTPETTKVAARAAPAPDLRSMEINAAQLPMDGWLALAREETRKGEWRLALRALYLAHLAQLAAEGLISLARFKTNLDYEYELRRRSAGAPEPVGRFAARRRLFEAVWYGAEPADAALVDGWMRELEVPRT